VGTTGSHLAIQPVQSSGRFAVVDGQVLFQTLEENHAVALAASGLPAAPGTPVGIYTARQIEPGGSWTFISVDTWAIGGNRVAPSAATIEAARQAFLRSGFDVSRAFGGR
jgi:hypothetical protein